MTKKIVKTERAPAPIGPYNQATVAGNLVFCSGQIPIDPATGQLETGEVACQARLVLTNLQAVLAAAGATLDQVTKTTIFLADMNDFPVVNKVYGEFFPEATAPARSTVQVGRLPKDVKVEIDAIAVL
jgi:2-iminobutanoate/2-iminopropanoate deaminase